MCHFFENLKTQLLHNKFNVFFNFIINSIKNTLIQTNPLQILKRILNEYY